MDMRLEYPTTSYLNLTGPDHELVRLHCSRNLMKESKGFLLPTIAYMEISFTEECKSVP